MVPTSRRDRVEFAEELHTFVRRVRAAQARAAARFLELMRGVDATQASPVSAVHCAYSLPAASSQNVCVCNEPSSPKR